MRRYFEVCRLAVIVSALVLVPLRAAGQEAVERSLAREFPSVSLGSETTTFTSGVWTANDRTVQGWRARFPVPSVDTRGLSALEAANASLQARAKAERLSVVYPQFFDDLIVVEGAGQRVVLRALAARASVGKPSNGMLIYEGVADGVDAIEIPRRGRSEELLLLRDERAPRTYEWEIVEMTGVADVALHDGAIRFLPVEREQPAASAFTALTQSLEIERPWVVDAQGRRSETAAHWSLVAAGGDAERQRVRLTLSGTLRFPLVVDPSFSTTGSMITGRSGHTATLLPNGKVLIAGGYAYDVLKSAELYDPLTGTFAATGSMATARLHHTATLLPTGRVYVVGGQDEVGALKTAELYDPATGTFTATTSLSTGRYYHTATLLPTGNVLLAGGSAQGTRGRDIVPSDFGRMLLDAHSKVQRFTLVGSITNVSQYSRSPARRYASDPFAMPPRAVTVERVGPAASTDGPGQSKPFRQPAAERPARGFSTPP
jgi:hypothetical protein